jgi:hypothetical protein
MRNSLFLGLLTLAACVADPVGPGEHRPGGQVRFVVSVVDTGTADLNGYLLRYGPNSMPIGRLGASFIHPDLPAGPLTTSLDSLETWCVADPAEQTAEVVEDALTDVRFDVTCATMYATARVIVRSTVADYPDPNGYVVTGTAAGTITGVNDTIHLPMPARVRSRVAFSGLANWCTSAETEQWLTPEIGDTLTVEFTANCAAVGTDARLVVDRLGPASTAPIYVRVDGSVRLALKGGTDTTIRVRRDRLDLIVDSVGRGCVSFAPTTLRLETDTTGAPPPTQLRFGCGRLSGLSERSFHPMVLLETGLDGTDTAALGVALQHPHNGKLSRNGAWIVGEQYRLDNGFLEWRSYRERVTGGDFAVLADWTSDNITFPSWGPDSTHVTYLAQLGLSKPHIVVVDKNGGSPDTLRIKSYGIASPAWSPTGDRLAFTSWCPSPSDCAGGISIYSPGDSIPQLYPASVWGSGELAWSPDGTRIAFVGPGGRIHVLRLSDGSVTQVVFSSSGHFDESPEWDPSGTMIGYIRIDPDHNNQPFHWAFVSPATGGPEVKIVAQRMYIGPFWKR